MKKLMSLFFLVCLFFCNILNSFDLKWKSLKQDSESGTITVETEFQTNEYIMANSIKAYAMPMNQYVSVIFEKQPDEMFIPNEVETIMVLNGNGKINFIIPTPDDTNISSIIVSYSIFNIKTQKILTNNTIEIFPKIQKYKIQFTEEIKSNNNEENIDNKIQKELDNQNISNDESIDIDNIKDNDVIIENNNLNIEKKSIKNGISDKIIRYMNNINNSFILYIIIFLLGILMSFTPCIYPMIPITLGILGIKNDINDKNSLKKNILKATFYVFGIAITFSILGILAVSGNLIFGGLVSKKWFLILVTIIFLITSLSMIDLFEFTVPSINIKNILPRNEYIYSFFYGIISGSITSPCISPGLFALLAFVAEKGNYINGILFLFCFGLGLGFPLWLIAVIFKNLISLPSSGMWMVRIKQIVGIMLLYIWISYAKLLISEEYIYLFIICIFVYLIYKNFKNSNYKNILLLDWILYLSCFISIAYFSYNFYNKVCTNKNIKNEIFFNDFSLAQAAAIAEEKLLLIDFTAEWCSICKDIDKKFFKSNIFWKNLNNCIVLLKIDCTSTTNNSTKELIEQYNIKGLPSIIIVNPLNDKIIHKFESDIIHLSISEFAEKIRLIEVEK